MAGGAVVTLLAVGADHPRPRHPRGDGRGARPRRAGSRPRTAVAKPLSAAVAIGTGGPFGAEGPIIVTGGALGSLVGQVLHVSASERKILLACGAAAGMAATFGTPLAAVVLAIELLLFEFSPRAFIPLVVADERRRRRARACCSATGRCSRCRPTTSAGSASSRCSPRLGLACGLLAVAHLARACSASRACSAGCRSASSGTRSSAPPCGRRSVCSCPRALGVGYDVIDDALAGRLAHGDAGVLAVGKLVIWWIALASGTSGGTLAPILLISCVLRRARRRAARPGVPRPRASRRGAFALVAMAATFGAAARAPFAAIVFVFELTRDYNVDPAADARHRPRRPRRPHPAAAQHHDREARPPGRARCPAAFHADPLRTTTVREVMTTEVGDDPEPRHARASRGRLPLAPARRLSRSSTTRARLSASSSSGDLLELSDGDAGDRRRDDRGDHRSAPETPCRSRWTAWSRRASTTFPSSTWPCSSGSARGPTSSAPASASSTTSGPSTGGWGGAATV